MSKSDLLARILETPLIAHVVPRLRPEVIHRVIQSCGLEDCGEIVALATPEQLMRVFDLDLWRSERAGLDERLDADRFGVWLEVLMESGAAVAAEKLIGMNVDLVIAALALHLLVFDRAAVSRSGRTIATYVIEPLRTGSWDAIVELLLFLDAEHHDYFNRVMRGCRRVSDSAREIDGLDALLTEREQYLFDRACDRERRRERQGYISPADARAFLRMARQCAVGKDATPPPNPIAAAYFRSIDSTAAADSPAPNDAAAATAVVMHILAEGGVLPQPAALLGGAHDGAPGLALIQSRMQFACDHDPLAFSTRTEELAYLANAMMAGCSVQSRPFTAREASDAAVAVCNLGLERWPHIGTSPREDFLVGHDLVSVFQVGWTVLHRDVCLYTAKRLIRILKDLRCDDREIQAALAALRIELTRHARDGAPWRARDALDVIMTLDMPAWAALLGLIDECPVIHAGVGASQGSRNAKTLMVGASDFAFISENSQIASVRDYMKSLPETLRG